MPRLLCASAFGAILLGACGGPLSPAELKVYRVGWFSNDTQGGALHVLDLFRPAMRDLGYIEGRNLAFEIRYDEGRAERAPALAAELLALKPDVIVVTGTPEALALKEASTTVPIVLAGTRDPVENGVVASLARPGGNITGAPAAGVEVVQRRLQLLKDTVPSASRVGFLFDALSPAELRNYQEAQSTAAVLGIELQGLGVRATEDRADVLAAAGRAHLDAIYLSGGPLIGAMRPLILPFLAASRLPSMTTSTRGSVDAGALMYYDSDQVEYLRTAAGYVDRIFKGARPADLAIQKPSKFEFIINMRTAKALGLTIPPSVLAQATELIQ